MYASTNIIYQYASLAKPKYYTVARMDLQKIPLLPLLSLSFKKCLPPRENLGCRASLKAKIPWLILSARSLGVCPICYSPTDSTFRD